MVGLRDHQLQRILDGDQPLMGWNGADQRFAHGRLARAGGTAEQNGQPGLDGTFQEFLDIPAVVQRKQGSKIPLRHFFTASPVIPTIHAVAAHQRVERRH